MSAQASSETAADPRRIALAVAPTGGRRTKRDHPALPITAQEIAMAAAESVDAGAAMVHLHVRDAAGQHLLEADAYRSAIAAIRAECGEDPLIQVTTEAVGIYGPDRQMAVVRDLRPEAVSLALRELVPDAAAEAGFAEFLEFLRRERIMPQIILYDMADAQRLSDLERRGMVPFDDIPVLLVLGRYTAGQQSQPADLLAFLPWARQRSWMMCAFGHREAACGVAAALMGGDVRIGFENNLHRPDGSLAHGNADLVAAVATPLKQLGVELASADDLRACWQR